MQRSRGSGRFVLALLAALVSSSSARAQLLLATTPGDPPAVAHAELAYAAGAGTPVTWLSLRIARGPVALVAALPKDALAEPGLDAWFAALETTASPNVLLPDGASDCGQATSYVHVSWPRAAGAAATELSVATPDDVAAALDEQGVTLSGKLPSAERYLVWSWAASDTEQTTRTLRVEGGAAPLTFLPGASFPILVSSVTRGASAFPDEVPNSDLLVTFVAGKPTSDYRDRLSRFLDAEAPSPLLEMRARGPLFDWALYDDKISLAPLVRSYAQRAKTELPGLDVDACSDQLRALRSPDAPAASACGAARDASLALAAAGTELPTLQRFAISGNAGLAPSAAKDGGDPSEPLLRAKRLDDSACPTAQQPPIVLSPPSGNDGVVTPGPSGGATVVVEETVVVDDGPTEVNCGGSPQPDPAPSDDPADRSSCSSDTSSTSDSSSSDSSCSGDSSSSSDSSDKGCASDTSSTSDSSSSDGTSSGCDSGSKESGYDGDTCSGSAAPGAERSEKAQASLTAGRRPSGPRRMKTSLWSMAVAALVLPIRRRKRGSRQRG